MLKEDFTLMEFITRCSAAGCVIVFAKSRTLELGDNILRIGLSSTTDIIGLKICRIRWKKRKIKAITAFKVIAVGTNRKPVCDFLLVIVTDILSRNVSELLFKFRTLCVFEPPFGGLGTTYDVHLELIRKRVVDLLLMLIELFSLGVRLSRYERKQIENRRFLSNAVIWPKISGIEVVAPTNHFCTDS